MATAIITEVKKPEDAWDRVSTVHLKLSREEAKVIFTVIGEVLIGDSGPAGQAAARIFDAINGAVGENAMKDNNLYVVGEPDLVIASK